MHEDNMTFKIGGVKAMKSVLLNKNYRLLGIKEEANDEKSSSSEYDLHKKWLNTSNINVKQPQPSHSSYQGDKDIADNDKNDNFSKLY